MDYLDLNFYSASPWTVVALFIGLLSTILSFVFFLFSYRMTSISIRNRLLIGASFPIVAVISLFIFQQLVRREIMQAKQRLAAYIEEIGLINSSTPGFLEVGTYQYQDLWQIGKQLVTIVRPITITGEYPDRRLITFDAKTNVWTMVLLDYDTTLRGSLSKSNYSNLCVVTTNSGSRRIVNYLPLKGRTK